MRGAGRRGAVVGSIAVAIAIAGTGCGQTVKHVETTPPFSPLPSPTIAGTVPAAVRASLCEHLGNLQQTISGVQATPGQAASKVKTALETAAVQLQSDEQQLQAAGQPQLASLAQTVITAIATLDQQIPKTGKLPSNLATALSAASLALQQTPAGLCPPPTT